MLILHLNNNNNNKEDPHYEKLVTLLLTAALAITAATTAFATEITPGADGNPNPSSKQIDVTYTVAPSYTVTIPTSVTLDSAAEQNKATVSATNVTVPNGKKVKVALNTNFTVESAEHAKLTYKVMKGEDTVKDKDTVLEVAPDAKDKKGETTLTFLIDDDVTYSGNYTGAVTFTVSVDKATT